MRSTDWSEKNGILPCCTKEWSIGNFDHFHLNIFPECFHDHGTPEYKCHEGRRPRLHHPFQEQGYNSPHENSRTTILILSIFEATLNAGRL